MDNELVPKWAVYLITTACSNVKMREHVIIQTESFNS